MTRRARIFTIALWANLFSVTALSAEEECPPMVSCSYEDGPCSGELIGEVVVDLTDLDFEFFGLFSYWANLGFCRYSCSYEVTGADGEVYRVEIENLDCSES